MTASALAVLSEAKSALDTSPVVARIAKPKPVISPSAPQDRPAVAALMAETFGPGRFARTAYRIREAAGTDATAWFVARHADGALAGAIGMTAVQCGERSGHMLGPVAVRASDQRGKIGSALIQHALFWADDMDSPFVILVGDRPYYGRFGFEPTVPGAVRLPGPVDLNRVLARCRPPLHATDLVGELRGLAKR